MMVEIGIILRARHGARHGGIEFDEVMNRIRYVGAPLIE